MAWSPPALKRRKWFVEQTRDYATNLFPPPSLRHLRYLIIDTRNWWAGQHVLVSPYAVREINWGNRQMRLDITREKIKASPPWHAPLTQLDQIYERQLHEYYGWPGYGW